MNKKTIIGIIVAAALVILIAVLFLLPKNGNGNKADETSETTSNVESGEAQTTQAKQEYPVAMDDEKLSLESIFQYSGVNPDCNMEEGENIASIQMTNQSGKYLKEATVQITLSDDTELNFLIQDVPDKTTIYAFDTKNTSCEQNVSIKDVKVDATYSETTDDNLLDTKVTAKTTDGKLSISNESDETLKGLKVVYHDSMEGVLYGGTAYQKTIESIGAGEAESVDTEEVMIGDAVVTAVEE